MQSPKHTKLFLNSKQKKYNITREWAPCPSYSEKQHRFSWGWGKCAPVQSYARQLRYKTHWIKQSIVLDKICVSGSTALAVVCYFFSKH